MSEYHFEYQCTSKADASNKQALRFSLYQDYDGKNPDSLMKVMIYIPKELQGEDFVEARLYYQENGVDFPDPSSEEWQSRVKVKSKKDIDKDNAVFIVPSYNCSGTGVLELVRKGSKKVALEDTYLFTINFSKKQPIYYEIKEKKNGKYIQVRVCYPRIRKDIDLHVCFTQKRKPLKIGEYTDKTHQVKDKDGEPKILTLEVKEDDINYATFHVKVEKTIGPDYRLTFIDKDNFEFYILVDESEITVEELGNKENYYKEEKRLPYKRIATCPYCGANLVLPAKDDGLAHTCDGRDFIDGSFAKLNKRRKKDKTGKDVPYEKTTVVCQNCYYSDTLKGPRGVVDGVRILPDDIFEKPVMHTMFIGARNSGKTMFLASLINLQDDNKSEPNILSAITRCFTRNKNKIAEEFEPESFMLAGNKIVPAVKTQKNRNQARYALEVNKKAENHTPLDSSDAISWNPQSYALDKLGYVFFYDVPGEIFDNENNNMKLHSFDMVDSIIAVVDGYPTLDDNNVLDGLERCLDKILNTAKDKDQIKEIPLAVVFTKMDRLLKDHTDKTPLPECFDDNCHITREDIFSMLPKNGKYEGSMLQRHIDNSSYELVHYLKEMEPDSFDSASKGENFTSKIKSFKRWKFFSVSALGSNEVLDNDKNVLCKRRTLRVELPLIWLMYQKHLIKK